MRGSFFGLNVAVRGLYTAQRNLDVVNHNLNNVNTPGYSRQKNVQVASTPIHMNDGTGMVGSGAEVISVNRVRDEYLDFKYWSENISFGEWSTKKELLSDLEAIFGEPSDSGFTQVMNEFYGSLHELAKDPSSEAARSIVREKGVTVAKYFNSMAAHFEKQQGDINYRTKVKVEEVNSIGTQIAELNRQIYTTELDGNIANDLRDQRTLLVDKLSKLINAEANELVTGKLPDGRDDKHFVVTISGKAFVDHFSISKLDTPQRKMKLNDEDIDNLYEVKWADGNSLDIKGGELKAYLDVRDGSLGQNGSPLYKGIPYYMEQLNEFAQTFAMSFNEGYSNVRRDSDGNIDPTLIVDNIGHADGYELDSVEGDTTPSGIRFFTMSGVENKPIDSATFIGTATTVSDICKQYGKITAKNLTVGLDIENDPGLISVADVAGQKGNINVLNNLISMRHDTHMFSEGSPEDFMKSMITTLGIDAQQAVRLSANQENIIKQVDNRRLSESGVSIDEEMANLVKFQHSYNASAKMITTMAEIYDTLINRLGVR
ncbi:MAG: flagellar hook-associated protein FlgK [Clostridia bacterium]|nr:flagellar hook-associated protein FlgK [Clostridia bacterium]